MTLKKKEKKKKQIYKKSPVAWKMEEEVIYTMWNKGRLNSDDFQSIWAFPRICLHFGFRVHVRHLKYNILKLREHKIQVPSAC